MNDLNTICPTIRWLMVFQAVADTSAWFYFVGYNYTFGADNSSRFVSWS